MIAETAWGMVETDSQDSQSRNQGRNPDQSQDQTSPPDLVNHPPHYTTGSIECIEAIQAALTPEEFQGFLKGSVIKYIWRAPYKGSERLDHSKAAWYVDQLERLKKESGKAP